MTAQTELKQKGPRKINKNEYVNNKVLYKSKFRVNITFKLTKNGKYQITN